jgi:Thioredoxin-like
MKSLFGLSLIAGLMVTGGTGSAIEAPVAAAAGKLEIVPTKVPPLCNAESVRAQVLFDLCQSQLALLREAQQKAQKSGKSVLVAFGADWCIWCYVFEAHVLGQYGIFVYRTSDGPVVMDEKVKQKALSLTKGAAAALQSFVADQFVVVNIGQEATETGLSVLRDTSAEKHFSNGLPFIYVLDQNGKFEGAIKSEVVEVRRDERNPYRGYDRVRLLAALKSLTLPKSIQ